MAWRRPGDKPLSEPMMVSLSTHICVTRPQWVNDTTYSQMSPQPLLCLHGVDSLEEGCGVTSLTENREGDSTLHKTSYRNISQNLEDASFSNALKLQHRCPGSCQISKRSRACESLRDLTIRRLMRWWIGPQVSSHLILTTGVIQTIHHYLQQWLSLLTLICVYRRRWIKEPDESIVTLIYLHPQKLTHWGRVTHICVDKLTIIGSDNGLSPGRRQAIIWTNAGILLIGPLGTNFSEFLSQILTFSFNKMRLKVSSAK